MMKRKILIVGGFNNAARVLMVIPNRNDLGGTAYPVPRWFGRLLRFLRLAI